MALLCSYILLYSIISFNFFSRHVFYCLFSGPHNDVSIRLILIVLLIVYESIRRRCNASLYACVCTMCEGRRQKLSDWYCCVDSFFDLFWIRRLHHTSYLTDRFLCTYISSSLFHRPYTRPANRLIRKDVNEWNVRGIDRIGAVCYEINITNAQLRCLLWMHKLSADGSRIKINRNWYSHSIHINTKGKK